MNDFSNQIIYKNRLKAADLINEVLVDKKTVQTALSEFPNEKNDINIKCAFDALMHREADEDLRAKDADYAMVQDEYLEFIAQTLKQNKQLPKNVVAQYLKFYKDDIIAGKKKGFDKLLEYVKRTINF